MRVHPADERHGREIAPSLTARRLTTPGPPGRRSWRWILPIAAGGAAPAWTCAPGATLTPPMIRYGPMSTQPTTSTGAAGRGRRVARVSDFGVDLYGPVDLDDRPRYVRTRLRRARSTRPAYPCTSLPRATCAWGVTTVEPGLRSDPRRFPLTIEHVNADTTQRFMWHFGARVWRRVGPGGRVVLGAGRLPPGLDPQRATTTTRSGWPRSSGSVPSPPSPTSRWRCAAAGDRASVARTCDRPRAVRRPADDFVFLYVFDYSSYVDRKNPSAWSTPSSTSSAMSKGVRLVLKLSHADPARRPAIAGCWTRRGRTRASRSSRRCSTTRTWSRSSATADCYVSPHRSEGFGLTLAEAMLRDARSSRPTTAPPPTSLRRRPAFPSSTSSWSSRRTRDPIRAGTCGQIRRASTCAVCSARSAADPAGGAAAGGSGTEEDHRAVLLLCRRGAHAPPLGRICTKESIVRSVGGAIRRKVQTFKAIRRSDGPAVAFKVALFSARNSFVYWVGRLLAALHLRSATPPSTWRAIEASAIRISVVDARLRHAARRAAPVHRVGACTGAHRVGALHVRRRLHACGHRPGPRSVPRVGPAHQNRHVRRAARHLGRDQPCGRTGHRGVHRAPRPRRRTARRRRSRRSPTQRAGSTISTCSTRTRTRSSREASTASPYCKPDWSPEYLHSVMYVLHCLTIRKALFWQLGGLRGRFDGVAGLRPRRCAPHASRVASIMCRAVLYHWRKVPGSAAAEVDAKPAALLAARGALAEHAESLARRGASRRGPVAGTFRLRRPLDPPPKVTLVVLTADPVVSEVRRPWPHRLLRAFVDSVRERTTYPEPAARRGARRAAERRRPRAPWRPAAAGPSPTTTRSVAERGFSFARKANHAVGLVETEYFILLNDDLEVVSPGWVEALDRAAHRPGGRRGGRAAPVPGRPHPARGRGDRRARRRGPRLPRHGAGDHVGHGPPPARSSATTRPSPRRCSPPGAVPSTSWPGSTRCSPTTIRTWTSVCARGVAGTGSSTRRSPNWCTTRARASSAHGAGSDEVALFRERWADVMERDPYYNPNLPRDRTDYEP